MPDTRQRASSTGGMRERSPVTMPRKAAPAGVSARIARVSACWVDAAHRQARSSRSGSSAITRTSSAASSQAAPRLAASTARSGDPGAQNPRGSRNLPTTSTRCPASIGASVHSHTVVVSATRSAARPRSLIITGPAIRPVMRSGWRSSASVPSGRFRAGRPPSATTTARVIAQGSGGGTRRRTFMRGLSVDRRIGFLLRHQRFRPRSLPS